MPLIVIPFLLIIFVSTAIISVVFAIACVMFAASLAFFAKNFLWSIYAIIATRIYGTANLSALDIAQFVRTAIDTSDALEPLKTSNLRSRDVDREDFLWKYLSKERTGRMTEIICLRPNRALEKRIYGFDVDSNARTGTYHERIFSCYISSDNQIHFTIFKRRHISFFDTRSIIDNAKRMQNSATIFEKKDAKRHKDAMKAQEKETQTLAKNIETDIRKKEKILEKLKAKNR